MSGDGLEGRLPLLKGGAGGLRSSRPSLRPFLNAPALPFMDLPSLIAGLSRPEAYPFPVADVEVHQTHISVVFLAGEFAYKLKKPVKLPFLDFSTLELRRHFCEEELRLNRRLAAEAYLAVVPVVSDGASCRFEGSGQPIDWAVKMRRLPAEATLQQRVLDDRIDAGTVQRLAERIARFHAEGERSDRISSFGRFTAVAHVIRENFSVAAPTVGRTISAAVHERLTGLTERALDAQRALIDARAARGVPCDTHGDLHLDHVYLFLERQAPDDLVIVDCIEFNESYRSSDPIADMAFLAMDLEFHGRRDLAQAFSAAYFTASDDEEGRALLPLYLSYRAAVRAKVDGLQLDESEIPQADRDQALVRARGHWLLALNALEEPGKRACLLVVGGLPGTGKSTLAAALATAAGMSVIRSDVVRKELAGLSPGTLGGSSFGAGLYTPEWTDRTYAECLRRAEERLFAGERVIVDASFGSEARRRMFVDAARDWGVPIVLLLCEAPAEITKRRLDARHGDPSDADWAVHVEAAKGWEPLSPATARIAVRVAAETASIAIDAALSHLRSAGLM